VLRTCPTSGEVASEVVALRRSRISKTGENAITVRYVAYKRGGTATDLSLLYRYAIGMRKKYICVYRCTHSQLIIRATFKTGLSSASFRARRDRLNPSSRLSCLVHEMRNRLNQMLTLRVYTGWLPSIIKIQRSVPFKYHNKWN